MGTAGVKRSARQNFVASKLKVNFFVLLRVASLVLQALVALSALKNSVNSVGTLRVRSGKESFGFKKLIRARLDTCLRLSTIDEVVSRRCKLRNHKTGE